MSNLANLEVKESSTLSMKDLGSNKVFRCGSGRSKGNKDVQLMPFDALCSVLLGMVPQSWRP